LPDIQLSTASASWTFLGPTRELEFLSIVEVAKVPLSLVAGPACNVWTTNARTEEWFDDTLTLHLSQESQTASYERAWWQGPSNQSEIGVLAKVKDSAAQILFYAIVDQPQDRGTPPTPPPSSSNAIAQGMIIRVQALPLCPDFLSFLPSPPPASSTITLNDVQFLPSIDELRTEAIATEKKRKRVEEVFDTAASQQRKARRRGGESIAVAASKLSNINTLIGQKKPKLAQSQKEGETKSQRKSSFSQSITDGTTFAPPIQNARPHSRSPSFSSETRPASRRGLLESNVKRSSLSRVTSLSENATVEDANKEMISRLVMAGMRLYGMQRKKPAHLRRNSENISNLGSSGATTSGEGVKEEVAKDEEYKLMYHQTYKAACFAHVSEIYSGQRSLWRRC
jgi:hypothetical protein